MIDWTQTSIHDPPRAIGDCLRTCYACLLEIHPSDVPHFAEPYYRGELTAEESSRSQRDWLRTKFGLDVITVPVDPQMPRSWEYYPNGLCIAGGKSPRGHIGGHAVIWRWDALGGRLVHDPHPDRSGLVGPPEDLTFLVPLDPAMRHSQ